MPKQRGRRRSVYPFTIEKTKERYYTPLPGVVVGMIRPWLDRNGVDYDVLLSEDLIGREGFEKIPQEMQRR